MHSVRGYINEDVLHFVEVNLFGCDEISVLLFVNHQFI